MDLLTDVRDVSRIGYGFMASKALFAALDLDLFTRLARQASTLDELAEGTGIPAKRLQTLMTALRALGLVGIDTDGRFINSLAAADYLSKLSPSYYGDYFRFQIDRQVYPHMEGLLPAMHGRAGSPFYALAVDPDEARHFSVARHVGSLGPAHLLSRRLAPVDWRRTNSLARRLDRAKELAGKARSPMTAQARLRPRCGCCSTSCRIRMRRRLRRAC